MTTDEFIKKVEDLGLIVCYDKYLSDEIRILVEGKGNIAEIKVYLTYVADIDFSVAEGLPTDTAKELFNLIHAYTGTPVSKRYDSKYRYWLNNDVLVKSVVSHTGEEFYEFLDGSYIADDEGCRTLFTDMEFEEAPTWVKMLLDRGHLDRAEVK